MPPIPTAADVFARVEELPMGMSAIARHLLNAPGTTSDHLMLWAEALDAGSTEERELYREPSFAEDRWRQFAAVLRFAAPRYAGAVPRNPATPEDAEAALHLRAFAASLATAMGGTG